MLSSPYYAWRSIDCIVFVSSFKNCFGFLSSFFFFFGAHYGRCELYSIIFGIFFDRFIKLIVVGEDMRAVTIHLIVSFLWNCYAVLKGEMSSIQKKKSDLIDFRNAQLEQIDYLGFVVSQNYDFDKISICFFVKKCRSAIGKFLRNSGITTST